MRTWDEIKQALYLIADELRGMATIGRHFSTNLYERERAYHTMELAARVAALAEDAPEDDLRAAFLAEPWLRASPLVAVEAAVFSPRDELLLIRRGDSGAWALPGGLSEIGRTPAESALHELWEEAGLRGRVAQLLGIFDNRLSEGRARFHVLVLVFEVVCDALTPSAGAETLDVGLFPLDALPTPLHPGHARRIATVLQRRHAPAYFDPADFHQGALPVLQRPDRFRTNGHAATSPPPTPDKPPAAPLLWHMLTRR